LIFINVFIYFSFNLVVPVDNILIFFQINRNIIFEYEIWRLFTSMFFHIDPLHLFSNMIALLLFGASVENNRNISKIQYFIVYFVSGLIGNLFSLLLLPLDVISLGASGAIFGLIGVAFIIIATDSPPLLIYALLYVAIFIISSIAPGINLWAHLFGLLGGILFGYLFYTRKRKNEINY
ncbi:hypothetical protein LCGC14_1095010, partial [marine sediment metagenome]|nr:rhomboid family intramembrane serine protease [archaeon]